jgi:hypothetical protein
MLASRWLTGVTGTPSSATTPPTLAMRWLAQRELVAEETDGFASMRDSLRTDLALDALELAIWRRQAQLQGLVHHPDRAANMLASRCGASETWIVGSIEG